MDKISCNGCVFFDHGEQKASSIILDEVRYGLCKRYPEPMKKAFHDWCGEWSSLKEFMAYAPKETQDAPHA